jgi:polar amino acid transport system permease protein
MSSTAFMLAVVTFAIVFGAFAANVIYGAMQARPPRAARNRRGLRHEPRPGLPAHPCAADVGLCAAGPWNLWMILIKATPLLFLLGVKDIVYWARELGGIEDPGL